MKVNWESLRYMIPVYLIIIAIIVGHWSINWVYFLAGIITAYLVIFITKFWEWE